MKLGCAAAPRRSVSTLVHGSIFAVDSEQIGSWLVTQEVGEKYDVVVMGGGPAGSTLGAILARRTNLRIALFDKEIFPREHIGESFAHPVVPALEASGALEKVLASECRVQNLGGIYAWDSTAPKVPDLDARHQRGPVHDGGRAGHRLGRHGHPHCPGRRPGP